MALIQEDFVSANTYNSLPTIQEAVNVPREHAADLGHLQQLLAGHNVPESISIRLIHRHYDIADGEAMVFRDIELPAHGTVEVMRATPIASAQLHGMNFLVSSTGRLQAYEYTNDTTIDLSEYETFITEFVKIVVERKLQHKFGLKINHHRQIEIKADRKEFEFPEEQCTVTIPTNLPLPEATHEIDVDTDWGALDSKHTRNPGKSRPKPKPKPKPRPSSTRTTCSHGYPAGPEDCRGECTKEDGIMFDGRIVQLGTPFYGLLNNLMEVW
ncbi:hypothetical protein V502_09344 [Pseudogymnoascus sp. VKM F-4520 (FW-2644)]|nr:hypothetical protein V502_09344 [Pseudogymnoascus sp. VKM F-4520 (FW-2644)]